MPAAAVISEGSAAVVERERWLADTLLAVTDTLVEGFDLREHLAQVSARFSQLLDGSSVAVAVTGEGPRDAWTVAATGRPERALLELEEVLGSGPATEAMRNGRRVAVSTTGGATERWPHLAPGLRVLRLSSVLALPLCHRERVLGAVVTYRRPPAPLPGTVLEPAEALADGAAIGIAQARTVARARRLAAQLQGALDSRVAIEQAKGVLAERLAVPVDDAFGLMRRHARSHGRRLDLVARDVVHGTMSATELRVAS